MRIWATLIVGISCGGAAPVARPAPDAPWPVPAGWTAEDLPFPLGFAPALPHAGVEQIRFPPGFLDPASGAYWSYTFIWRTEDAAVLDAAALGTELTLYFRGLVAAVDEAHEISASDRSAIVATAVSSGARFELTVRTHDAFATKAPVELVGWADRRDCRDGALWRFVFAPAQTSIRADLEALARRAGCVAMR